MGRTKAIMGAPCAKCPFRKDVPIYISRERRAEISTALLSGQTFWCHNTVDYDGEPDEWGEEQPDTTDSIPCAGAEKALLGIGQTSQMGRISSRLGLLDYDKVETTGAPSWDLHTWQTLGEGSVEGEEIEEIEEYIETCSVVNQGCLAPAGYAVGGGVVEGTEAADEHCEACGEAVCSNCITANGMCEFCDEEEEDEA